MSQIDWEGMLDVVNTQRMPDQVTYLTWDDYFQGILKLINDGWKVLGVTDGVRPAPLLQDPSGNKFAISADGHTVFFPAGTMPFLQTPFAEGGTVTLKINVVGTKCRVGVRDAVEFAIPRQSAIDMGAVREQFPAASLFFE